MSYIIKINIYLLLLQYVYVSDINVKIKYKIWKVEKYSILNDFIFK